MPAAEPHYTTPPASTAHQGPVASPPTASTSTAPKRTASLLESPTLKKPARPQPVPVRRRFVPKDFLTPDWTVAQVKGWMKEHPALKKRNFFVLQRHHPATHPKHFDLRLQLDNQLVTFCIPSKDGLSRAPRIGEGDDMQWGRLALEEQRRAVNIALLDGGGMGVTMCEDIGEYKVLPRTSDVKKRDKRKAAIRKQGFSDDTTTEEEQSEDGSAEAEDKRQETLFAGAFYHASFLPLPPRWGQPGQPAAEDTGDRRGFVLELNGRRHRGLRLQFQRWSSLRKNSSNKYGPPDIPRRFQHQWYFNLDARPDSSGIIFPSYKLSLLTERSMEEIAADKDKSTTTAEDWYAWNAPLARKWEAGVKGRRPWNDAPDAEDVQIVVPEEDRKRVLDERLTRTSTKPSVAVKRRRSFDDSD